MRSEREVKDQRYSKNQREKMTLQSFKTHHDKPLNAFKIVNQKGCALKHGPQAGRGREHDRGT